MLRPLREFGDTAGQAKKPTWGSRLAKVDFIVS